MNPTMMRYCENLSCSKELVRGHTEYDDQTGTIICLDCYTAKYGMARPIPVSISDNTVSWGLQYDGIKGLSVEVGLGEAKLKVSASPDQLRKIFE